MNTSLTTILFSAIIVACNGYLVKAPKEGRQIKFRAIDCSNPTRFRSTAFSDVCQNEPMAPAERVSAVVLQRLYERTQKAVRCERRITVLHYICGAFSHSKLVKAADVELPEPFGEQECKRAVHTGTYISNQGKAIAMELNREYQYQEVITGSLTNSYNNVGCVGYSRMIDGKKRDSIVSLATYTVVLRDISVEYNRKDDVLTDLHSHTAMDSTCARRTTCKVDNFAYVMTKTNPCPYVILQAGQMEKVVITTRDHVQMDSLLVREHKTLLRLGEKLPVLEPCINVGQGVRTNHPDIVVLFTDDVESVQSAVPAASGDNVDLQLEISTSEAFLEYRFMENIQKYLQASLTSMCKMGLHSMPALVPSPLHPDRFVHISGEVFSELACTTVTVTATIGDRPVNWCARDLLPVQHEGKLVFLQANSRMIVRNVPSVMRNCSRMEIPIFVADSGLLIMADPAIRQARIQLDSDGLKLFSIGSENVTFTEDDFGKALLYDRDAMLSFNHIIHYGMTEAKVVSSLTKAYCSSGACGSYTPDSGSSFNVKHLMDHALDDLNIGMQLWHGLEKMGSICSVFVAIYVIGYAAFFVCKRFAPGCSITAPAWMRRWTYMSARHDPAHELRPMLPQPALVPTVINASAPAYTPAPIYPGNALHDTKRSSVVIEPQKVALATSPRDFMDN